MIIEVDVIDVMDELGIAVMLFDVGEEFLGARITLRVA